MSYIINPIHQTSHRNNMCLFIFSFFMIDGHDFGSYDHHFIMTSGDQYMPTSDDYIPLGKIEECVIYQILIKIISLIEVQIASLT